MQLVIDQSVPEDLHSIAEVAVAFYAQNFMKRAQIKKVKSLTIQFVKLDDDAVGQMDTDDYSNFVMSFSDKNKDIKIGSFLTTLFHEQTHMRQYATGDLWMRDTGDWVWKGKVYKDDLDYWLHPWEHEAQGLEISAFNMFHAQHPEWKVASQKNENYNGRRKSGWKPLENQPLTNPVKSTT